MFSHPTIFILQEGCEEEPQAPVQRSFTIKDKNGRAVGEVHLSWGDEGLDDHSIELQNIEISDDHNPFKVTDSAIQQIFRKMEDVHRIYTMSKPQDAEFWRKLGFTYIDNGYFYRDRAR